MLSYKEHSEIKRLEKLIDENAGERQILAALKDLRYKKIGKGPLNKLIDHFSKSDYDWIPKKYRMEIDEKWFIGEPYETFMDFFSRKLSKKKKEEIIDNINSPIIIPNCCYVEAFGKFKDKDPILRLKKDFTEVEKDLKDFDINIPHYSFIDMKLLVSYYHRIHSPVNGKLVNMYPVEGNEDFFGKNSLWILEFETKKSPVYFLLVGESTIQDFDFLVEKKDVINIFDELGFFNWGSQTVILYNDKDFGDILLQPKKQYFAGDNIFSK